VRDVHHVEHAEGDRDADADGGVETAEQQSGNDALMTSAVEASMGA